MVGTRTSAVRRHLTRQLRSPSRGSVRFPRPCLAAWPLSEFPVVTASATPQSSRSVGGSRPVHKVKSTRLPGKTGTSLQNIPVARVCSWLSKCSKHLITDLGPLRTVAEGSSGTIDHVEDVHGLRAESLHASGPHVKTTFAERPSNAPQESRSVMGPDFDHGGGRGGIVHQGHTGRSHRNPGWSHRPRTASKTLFDVKASSKDQTEIGLQRGGVRRGAVFGDDGELDHRRGAGGQPTRRSGRSGGARPARRRRSTAARPGRGRRL